MSGENPKKPDAPPGRRPLGDYADIQDDPDDPNSDRPTVAPPFNFEEFAKKQTGSGPAPPPPSNLGEEPKTSRNVLAMANANSPTIAPPSLTKTMDRIYKINKIIAQQP